MQELTWEQWGVAEPFIERLKPDEVYAASLLSRHQHGRIFTDRPVAPRSALFWHDCGFAYIAGDMDEAFLESLMPLLYETYEPAQRRFRLHVYDRAQQAYFDAAKGLTRWAQTVFRFSREALLTQYREPPAGFSLCEADAGALMRFHGRVTPAYSWRTPEEFLRSGKAFCLCSGDEIAAMAFTAAIGAGKADIGVETAEAFRSRGLGKCVAAAATAYARSAGLLPVWRCMTQNAASAGIAKAVGYEPAAEHFVYLKQSAE